MDKSERYLKAILGELKDIKRELQNKGQGNELKKYLSKESNKQNYMICNYLKDDVVFVAKHIIIANEKDMKIIKEKFDKIDWIEIEL